MKRTNPQLILQVLVELFPAQHPACAAYLRLPDAQPEPARNPRAEPPRSGAANRTLPARPAKKPSGSAGAPSRQGTIGGPQRAVSFASRMSVVPSEWRSSQTSRPLNFDDITRLQAQVKRLGGLSNATVEEAEGCLIVDARVDNVATRFSVPQVQSPQVVLVEISGPTPSMWVMDYAALTSEHVRELIRTAGGAS